MKSSVLITFGVSAMTLLGLTTGMVVAGQDDGEGKKGARRLDRGDGPRGHQHGTHQGRPRSKAFEAVDANKDGVLSFGEFSQMGRLTKMDEPKRRKLFDFLDRDKDGKLHLRELQPREPSWLAPLRQGFAELDADKNGGLDLKEFSQCPQMAHKGEDVVSRIFARTDRNNNKRIERFELKWSGGPRARPPVDFAKYDSNTSGGLDFAEYSRLPLMGKVPEERRKKLFERIDADKSGEISAAEVKAAHKRHRHHPSHGKPQRGPGKDRAERAPEGDKRHRRGPAGDASR